MAYRRSKRKSYHNKRRVIKRRRKRVSRKRSRGGNFGKRVRDVINKQDQGVRQVRKANRADGFDGEQNQCTLQALYNAWHYADFEKLLTGNEEGTLDANHPTTQVNIDHMGQYVDPISGVLRDIPTEVQLTDNVLDGNEDYSCKFSRMMNSHLIRNTDVHPMDITVYEIVPKISRPLSSGEVDPVNECMTDIFKSLTLDDAGTDSGTYGEAAVKLLGSNNHAYGSVGPLDKIDSFDMGLKPGGSIFRKYWKIKKQQTFRLQSGDEIRWKRTLKNFTFTPKNLLKEGCRSDMIKGVTSCIMVKYHGVLGRGIAANQHNQIGYLKTEFVHAFESTATFIPSMARATRVLKALRVAKDDLGTVPVVLGNPNDITLTGEDLL